MGYFKKLFSKINEKKLTGGIFVLRAMMKKS